MEDSIKLFQRGCECSYCSMLRSLFRDTVESVLDELPPPETRFVGGPSRVPKDFLQLLFPQPTSLENAWDTVVEVANDLGHHPCLERKEGPIAWRIWKTIGMTVVINQLVKQIEAEMEFTPRMWQYMGQDMINLIYSLDRPSYFFKEPEQCSICLENMFAPEQTRCGHLFHVRCLRRWQLFNSACPYCRQEL